MSRSRHGPLPTLTGAGDLGSYLKIISEMVHRCADAPYGFHGSACRDRVMGHVPPSKLGQRSLAFPKKDSDPMRKYSAILEVLSESATLSVMLSFVRNRVLPSRVAQLVIQTGLKWQKDKCLEMGAALSYYALFSLFPITLVIAGVLGFLLGPDTNVAQQILAFTQNSLPPEAFGIVEDTLLKLNRQSVGAGVVGFSLSFFAASSVFSALDRSVDRIWKAEDGNPSEPTTLKDNAMTFVLKKLFAFGLVMSTAFLLLLSLLSNIAIRIMLDIISNMDQTITFIQIERLPVATVLQLSSSVLLVSLAVLLLFRFLPSTRTPWRDLWPGTLLTTLLLLSLQQLVSRNIIHIGGQYQSYGAIGGVMILMLWIYFTCQIFFLGCVMSYVYAHLFGSRRHRDLLL